MQFKQSCTTRPTTRPVQRKSQCHTKYKVCHCRKRFSAVDNCAMRRKK